MKSIEILLMILLLTLGTLSTKSDLKEGRIYNKTLAVFAGISIILGSVYYGYYARDLLGLFLMNYIVLAIISLILFYSHSFAGGDCKLVLGMGIIYPANYYLVYGNTFITLFFVLGFAIIYGYLFLVISSLRGLVQGKNKLTRDYVKSYVISFFKSFISATIYISAFNLLIIGLNWSNINEWLLRIFCIAIAWAVGKYEFLRKKSIIFSICIVDVIGGMVERVVPFSFRLENYILVIVLLLCQMTIRTDLYERIKIADLKKGMILSMGSSMLMQGSRVRGLPGISSEDLKSRLTETEVNSIIRWGKGKEIDDLIIVKKIPFAIFIFLGFISYFLIWSVVK